jgi:8-oxo-dGTP diphosphatase
MMTTARKQVVAAIIERDGEVLICQRHHNDPMPLKWEFPGGKIEPGEEPRAALARELEEELGIAAEVGRCVAVVEHQYGNGFAVQLQFFVIEKYTGEVTNRVFEEIRWEKRAAITGYDFLEADVPIVRRLANGELRLSAYPTT